LQAISGSDDRDMTSLSEPAPNFLENLDVDLSEVKIGFSKNLGYLKLDTEVEKVFESAVSVFSGLCEVVEEVHLDWGDPLAMQHCLFSVTAAMMYGGYVDSHRDQMDPGLVALIEHAKQYTAEDYARVQGERLAYYERVRLYFENYDYLVTPTLSVSAFPVEKLMPEHWEQHPWDWFSWAGFCYPFNLTWLPAATCPCGFSENGLPIGLQIISKKNADLAVLQLAYKFECALPWKHKTPIS
jgi:aspartyl-tRNA(Asn)/glutamyl-tRNA(Gln) amidotransferase subunit A